MNNTENPNQTTQTVTRYLKDYTPPPYLIPKTTLKFTLDPEHTTVAATLHLKLNSREYQNIPSELFLHGEELTLQKIAWGKTNAELTALTEGTHYRHGVNALGEEGVFLLNPASEFILYTEVVINPSKNTKLDGLYLSDTILVTQCEPEGFRRITYFLDRSDVLSVFTVHLEADQNHFPVLLSNGNEEGNEENNLAATTANNMHAVSFHDPFPKPSYLFAVVAGNLEVLEDTFTTASKKSVRLRIFAEPGRIARCTYAMEALKLAMKWDEEVYGVEYDLADYSIVVVDSFNLGAMENKGLNIFNSSLVLYDERTATDQDKLAIAATIAHEYFHNWTGNRITIRDWFQLTLKEGLTVYRDQCFSASFHSPAVERIKNTSFLRRSQFPEDHSTLAHPIQPQSYISMNNFYTVTVYFKGAEIIGMYETILGKKRYLEAVREYLNKYDGQAVTVNEFFTAMQALSPKDISSFMRWYTTPGTPTIVVKTDYQPDTSQYKVTLTQQLPKLKTGTNDQSLASLPLLIPLGFSVNVWSDDRAVCVSHGTWLLKENTETRTFTIPTHATSIPFLSVNENFSAPVIVKRNLTLNEWVEQFKIEGNLFLKWDTLQQIYLLLFEQQKSEASVNSATPSLTDAVKKVANIYRRILAPLLEAIGEGEKIVAKKKEPSDITRISQFLHYATINLRHLGDLSFLAELFKFPNFYELTQEVDKIDFEHIRTFENTFKEELVKNLYTELTVIYNTLNDLHLNPEKIHAYPTSTKNISAHGKRNLIAERELKNTILYLVAGNCKYQSTNTTWKEKAIRQCKVASNLTDELAGLKSALASGSENTSVQELVNEFYEKWRGDNLVINRWISALASTPEEHTFAEVVRIQTLPEFKITEPNKGKALFRAFIRDNPYIMNHKSGKGYKLATDFVIKLDTLNPILGADLLSYFPNLEQLPEPQHGFLSAELTKMSEKIKSKDILEILGKKLNE